MRAYTSHLSLQLLLSEVMGEAMVAFWPKQNRAAIPSLGFVFIPTGVGSVIWVSFQSAG